MKNRLYRLYRLCYRQGNTGKGCVTQNGLYGEFQKHTLFPATT